MDGYRPETRYRLSPRVAIRPEQFGAMAYHFGNRRLTFLMSPVLVDLVNALAEYPSATAAVRDRIRGTAAQEAAQRALANLAEREVIDAW